MNLRLATEADAGAVAAIYAPFCDASAVSFEYKAPTTDEMAARIRTVTEQHPWLVVEESGTVGGYAYAGPHHERAAYGWALNAAVYLGDGYRGRGIGRALYAALFDVLRMQGYFKVCAGITLPNPASVGLHTAMGFQLVGVYSGIGYKRGAWHDVAWYELALQAERADPPPPRPISDVVGTDAWRRMLARTARAAR
jgi:phosphinothricin acetyltransferase